MKSHEIPDVTTNPARAKIRSLLLQSKDFLQREKDVWDYIYDLYCQNNQLNIYRLLNNQEEEQNDRDLSFLINRLSLDHGDDQKKGLIYGLYLADNPDQNNKEDNARKFIRNLIIKDQDAVLDAFLRRYPKAFDNQWDYDHTFAGNQPHKISYIEYALNRGCIKSLKVLLEHNKTRDDSTFLWTHNGNSTLLRVINTPNTPQREQCIHALCVRYLENIIEYAKEDEINTDAPLRQYLAEREQTQKGLFVTSIAYGLPRAKEILTQNGETHLADMIDQAMALLDYPLEKFQTAVSHFAKQKAACQTDFLEELLASLKEIVSEKNLKNFWSKQVSSGAQIYSYNNAKLKINDEENRRVEYVRVPRGVRNIYMQLNDPFLSCQQKIRNACLIATQQLHQSKMLTLGRTDASLTLYAAMSSLAGLLNQPLTAQKVQEWKAAQAILHLGSPAYTSKMKAGVTATTSSFFQPAPEKSVLSPTPDSPAPTLTK